MKVWYANLPVFFDKAMSSEWEESNERSIKLPEEDPEIFQLYLHWIYYKKIPAKTEDSDYTEYLQLAKAIILGDKLQDSDFEDAAIDAMIEKSRGPTHLNEQALVPAVWHICKNTLEDSKARKLLLDFYVCCGTKEWVHGATGPRDLPQEFISDLVAALLQRRPRTDDSNPKVANTTCRYHSHASKNAICYKSKLGVRNDTRQKNQW